MNLFTRMIVYIPEGLHLLLLIVSLAYFFALMFRFNDIIGADDVDSIVD